MDKDNNGAEEESNKDNDNNTKRPLVIFIDQLTQSIPLRSFLLKRQQSNNGLEKSDYEHERATQRQKYVNNDRANGADK